MQSAFFKLVETIPYSVANEQMKLFAKNNYGKKGEAIVNMNYSAIDSIDGNLVEFTIPNEWKDLNICNCSNCANPCNKYFEEYIKPIQQLKNYLNTQKPTT